MANIGWGVIAVATLVAFTTASESDAVVDASESDAVVDASFLVHSSPKTLHQDLLSERLPLNVTILSPFQIRYTLGQRMSGDSLKLRKNLYLMWSQPKNAQLRLEYSGTAVTFVDIAVIQTSTLGNAYVADGGIGQRKISVIVAGRYTTKFQYTADFYGR